MVVKFKKPDKKDTGKPMDGHRYSHPAFGKITVSRISGGRHLFQSDMKHQHYIALRIHHAEVDRHLSNDWVHDAGQIVEVCMSENQWAHMVSSIGMGAGSPCTLNWLAGEGPIDHIIPELKKDQFDEEISEAAMAYAKIAHDLRALVGELLEKGKANKGDLNTIKAAADKLSEKVPAGMDFIKEQFRGNMEGMVDAGRAELEAHLLRLVHETGLAHLTDGAPKMIEGEVENVGVGKGDDGGDDQ